jgi:hypothetical protein
MPDLRVDALKVIRRKQRLGSVARVAPVYAVANANWRASQTVPYSGACCTALSVEHGIGHLANGLTAESQHRRCRAAVSTPSGQFVCQCMCHDGKVYEPPSPFDPKEHRLPSVANARGAEGADWIADLRRDGEISLPVEDDRAVVNLRSRVSKTLGGAGMKAKTRVVDGTLVVTLKL